MIHADYLQHLLELAEQKFGVSAPETQELRKELEEARKLKPKPAKEQRYLVGFRKF